ncbi:hypothetical protein [Microvirga puerhi]|uniref:Uncharacterized protein n=1 Tax=Microvirga puerhi TaxID=2876078 RepID=A0ABS7VJY7_9HYPH|nr:hypothetical protein [Microvirga puerhi]MBZ6075842.1 hypothetical protein [Microvirga puerhi]
MNLADEEDRLNEFLVGRSVTRVWRHRTAEVGIEFSDGTRLFVNWQPDRQLECSVTGNDLGGDES